MDAALVAGFFLILAVAAPCWGHDSRDRLVSAEERLAAWGFTWRDRVADGWDPEWWERAWRRSDAAAAAQRRLLARPARASSTGWRAWLGALPHPNLPSLD